MAIRTLLTIEQYNALEDPPGVRYELDRGELFVTQSPVPGTISLAEIFTGGSMSGSRSTTWGKSFMQSV